MEDGRQKAEAGLCSFGGCKPRRKLMEEEKNMRGRENEKVRETKMKSIE